MKKDIVLQLVAFGGCLVATALVAWQHNTDAAIGWGVAALSSFGRLIDHIRIAMLESA